MVFLEETLKLQVIIIQHGCGLPLKSWLIPTHAQQDAGKKSEENLAVLAP